MLIDTRKIDKNKELTKQKISKTKMKPEKK